MRLRLFVLAVLTGVALLSGARTSHAAAAALNGIAAAAGDLDPTFGAGGKLVSGASANFESVCGLVVQPDGRSVTAQWEIDNILDPENGPWSEGNLTLTWRSATGAVEHTARPGITMATNVDGLWCDLHDTTTCSFVQQPDGKLLLAATSFATGYKYCHTRTELQRLHPDGALDATFGANGRVVLDETASDFSSAIAFVGRLRVLSDGAILVPSTSGGLLGWETVHTGILRLSRSGAFEPGFDLPVLPEGGQVARLHDLAIQPDGKVVAGGSYDGRLLLARFLPTGALDPAFGGGQGYVLGNPAGDGPAQSANRVLVQAGGKIVTGGWPTLARYQPGGGLDPAFGPTGGQVWDFMGGDLVEDSAHRLVAAGSVVVASAGNFALRRYGANGYPDRAFGVDGLVLTPFGTNPAWISALGLLSDGRIAAAGVVNAETVGSDLALARYLGATTASLAARQAGARPVVDGDLAEWAQTPGVYVDRDSAGFVGGAAPEVGDLNASFKAAWAPEGLYVAARIGDDVLVGNNSAQIWGDDSLEVGIRTAADHQFTLAVDGRQAEFGSPITSLTAATRTVPGGWSIEALIPAASLGLAKLAAGQVYPFTFGVWDDDLRTYPGQTHMIWQGTSTNTYQPAWGSLDLSPTIYNFLQSTATPTPTPTATATDTPAPAATATATATLTPTPTPPPTPTRTATPTATVRASGRLWLPLIRH